MSALAAILVGASFSPLSLSARPAAPAALAQEQQSFDERYAELRAELVRDLHAFATWCGSKRMFGERDRAYELVLHHAPDDFDAHKGLKHVQQRDGSWTVPEKREASKDYAPRLLKSCGERRAKIATRFREDADALMDEHASDVSAERRSDVLDEVLRIDPDDAVVRALRGEVRAEDGAWILEETRRSRELRRALSRIVVEARARKPRFDAAEPFGVEAELGIDWRLGLQDDEVRILGTVARKEGAELARSLHVARRVHRFAFSVKSGLSRGFTVYLCGDAESRDRFLDGHPQLTDANPRLREEWRGVTVGKTDDLVRWDATPEERIDGATEHVLSIFVEQTTRLQIEHGWSYSGVMSYLEDQVRRPHDERKARLDPATWDWARKGRFVLGESEGALARLFALPYTRFERSDHELAHALAAYVIEGHPTRSTELFRRLAAGEDAESVVRKVLGLDRARLRDRLSRWLEERG